MLQCPKEHSLLHKKVLHKPITSIKTHNAQLEGKAECRPPCSQGRRECWEASMHVDYLLFDIFPLMLLS